MEQVIKLLEESPAVYVGTADENGHPHVRPFALTFYKDGKFYFSTSNKTSAYRDLKNNPFVEISVMSKEYVWIRIFAKIVFTQDIKIKETAIATKEMLKNFFGSADNPEFNMFFLTEGTATIYDYSGQPPKTYTF